MTTMYRIKQPAPTLDNADGEARPFWKMPRMRWVLYRKCTDTWPRPLAC
jgi:hypothetical protein